jgi:hypothetical protein
MKRLEVIANQSVREDLIEELERGLPDIEYTLVPIVHGKGKRKRKDGTRTWPETNFLILSYLEEGDAEKAAEAVRAIARRFPAEGLCAAISEASLLS